MGAKILLIDDDPFARQLYGDYLEEAGFEVEKAESGEHGLELLTPGRFDVLLTDLLLPGLGGLEVLAAARQIDPDVGVLIFSALDVVDPAVRAIKGGAFDYLVKPVSAETLRFSVSRCLEYQALLRQNTDLKSHLALSEGGARLSSVGHKEDLWPQTAQLLAAHTDCAVALVVERTEFGAPVVRASASEGAVDPRPSSPLDARIFADLDAADDPVAVAPPPDTDWSTGLAIHIGEAHAALLFPRPEQPFSPASVRAGLFLCSSAAVALAAIGRIERAESLAYADHLTGLFNGRYLSLILDRQIDSAARAGGCFSLLFMDLDHFKKVNDAHGHLVGSSVLVEVGEVIQQCVRGEDIAVRYGGDEFVVVLPHTDSAHAFTIAERMRSAIQEHEFSVGGDESTAITASIGVVTYPDHASDKKALIRLADAAMYKSKRAQRNATYLASTE